METIYSVTEENWSAVIKEGMIGQRTIIINSTTWKKIRETLPQMDPNDAQSYMLGEIGFIPYYLPKYVSGKFVHKIYNNYVLVNDEYATDEIFRVVNQLLNLAMSNLSYIKTGRTSSKDPYKASGPSRNKVIFPVLEWSALKWPVCKCPILPKVSKDDSWLVEIKENGDWSVNSSRSFPGPYENTDVFTAVRDKDNNPVGYIDVTKFREKIEKSMGISMKLNVFDKNISYAQEVKAYYDVWLKNFGAYLKNYEKTLRLGEKDSEEEPQTEPEKLDVKRAWPFPTGETVDSVAEKEAEALVKMEGHLFFKWFITYRGMDVPYSWQLQEQIRREGHIVQAHIRPVNVWGKLRKDLSVEFTNKIWLAFLRRNGFQPYQEGVTHVEVGDEV